jgi:two-component system, LuxR family, sensor kinase FixL
MRRIMSVSMMKPEFQALLDAAVDGVIREMSAGIGHELNQPLTAIANYAQACDRLLGMEDPDVAEVREALKHITAQAVRAGDIIRDLRALACNDCLKRESTDINVLIGGLTELIQPGASGHDVSYRVEMAAGLPPANVDRAQIQQVLINLARNAVEALSEGDAAVREITVRTRLSPEGDVEIAVCDTGPGVSQAIAPRLFAPFCTSKPNGTGLGLAISRTIVKSHQGSLDYYPNVPSGACFVVRLPPAKNDNV